VLAHEYTHAIDPCRSQFATYKINKEKFEALKTDTGDAPEEIKNPKDLAKDEPPNGRFNMFQDINRIYPSNKITAYAFDFRGSPEAIQYFIDKGVLEIVSQGIKNKVGDKNLKNYLWHETYKCAVRSPSRGPGFRRFDRKRVSQLAQTAVEEREDLEGEEYRTKHMKKEKEDIVRTYSKHPECMDVEKNSQMGEVLGDIVGARIAGDIMKEERAKGKELKTAGERLGPVSYFAVMTCVKLAFQKTFRMVVRTDYRIINKAVSDFMRSLDPHPHSKKRIDSIFLQNRDILDAIGCENKKNDWDCSQKLDQVTKPISGKHQRRTSER